MTKSHFSTLNCLNFHFQSMRIIRPRAIQLRILIMYMIYVSLTQGIYKIK